MSDPDFIFKVITWCAGTLVAVVAWLVRMEYLGRQNKQSISDIKQSQSEELLKVKNEALGAIASCRQAHESESDRFRDALNRGEEKMQQHNERLIRTETHVEQIFAILKRIETYVVKTSKGD